MTEKPKCIFRVESPTRLHRTIVEYKETMPLYKASFFNYTEYIRKDIVNEIEAENLILQKQVHRLEEELIRKTMEGSDVSSK